jgi:superfamily II DNA or RNA helicase
MTELSHNRTQSSIQLRSYQLEAVDAVLAAERRGRRRVLIVLPTGTGKTPTFAEAIRRRGGRGLVLVHRDELARQAEDKIRLVIPDTRVGIVKAERNETEAPIIVASVQTLARTHRLEQLGTFTTVVIDEAHHAAAESYRTILEHLGGFSSTGPLVIGVTATADRGDGRGLDDVFEEVVFERDMLSMIEQGYLCDLRAKQIRLDVDFRQLHTRLGDFVESEAEEMLLDADAPEAAVRAYHTYAEGRKALVFTPGVRSAQEMSAAFERGGVTAARVDGAMSIADRHRTLDAFKRGDIRVVSNCMVLTEGYDEPSLDCIIIARPTKSRPLYTQMIGRGARPWPGKNDCLVLDLVGSTTRHDLVTTASLFGVTPQALEHGTVFETVTSGAAAGAVQTRDDVLQRARLVAETVDLFRRRHLHWVHGEDETFILGCGVGHIILRPAGEGWTATFLTKDSSIVLASRLPLEYAQGVAEDYARKTGHSQLVDPTAAWRSRPASAKQLQALKRLRIRGQQGLTAGQASDLISAAIAQRCA